MLRIIFLGLLCKFFLRNQIFVARHPANVRMMSYGALFWTIIAYFWLISAHICRKIILNELLNNRNIIFQDKNLLNSSNFLLYLYSMNTDWLINAAVGQ